MSSLDQIAIGVSLVVFFRFSFALQILETEKEEKVQEFLYDRQREASFL